jgi:Chaperone of endosialidase
MSSIFDIFGTSAQQNAANAQIQGIQTGQQQATNNINAGTSALQTNYGAALQPYLQNYSQAQPGIKQLGNVLGLNGARGNETAQQALQATPGFQFQMRQGDAAVNAGEAASGGLNSGNQALALQQQGQGTAAQSYQNYVQNLMPYLGLAQNSAGGIAGVDTGLGNAVAGQDNTLGNLNYSAQTGIGNANANAALAPLTAGANVFNLLGSLGKIGTSGGGTVGGNIFGSFGGGGGVPGASGPTSVGGAPLSGGSSGLLGLAGSIFSDERLKEEISPVGKLYDGQPVYKYRYIGSPIWQIGVMAQDVEKVVPDAVQEVGGWKAVNLNTATKYAADLARFLEEAA